MRIVAAVMALIFSCTLAITAHAQELYENKTLGLSVQKPAAWYFITDKQYRDNIARTKMTDAEFQSLMLKFSSAPVFAITKYRVPYDDLNPSVKITVRPAGRANARNLLTVTKIVVAGIAKMVGKVDSIEEPKSMQISGFPAAYAAIDFTLETQEGRQFPTKSQLWIVLKDDLLFLIGAGTRQDERTGSRQEVQWVIDSIRLQ